MMCRLQKLPFFAAILCVMFLPLTVCAQSEEDKFEMKDCHGRSAGICLKGKCACDEWQIQLFKRDGKEWGLITGKTLESVQRHLKKNQDFDVSYARFFHIAVDDSVMNYQRPGKPICKTSCSSGASIGSSDEADRRDEIAEAADDLLRKTLEEIIRVTRQLAKIERKVGNPYRAVGFVMKDYANTLKDVFKTQKELRGKLAETSATMASTMADIEAFYGAMQSADTSAQQAYQKLPVTARGLLDKDETPETGGAWNNQRIRDFNNSITLQTLDLNQNQVTVTVRSEVDSSNRVTYQLQASDILHQTIAVQSTDAPDRWLVTFNTDGRRITKRTERDSGALTDNVSKMALFFSSEQAARAAAEALRASQ